MWISERLSVLDGAEQLVHNFFLSWFFIWLTSFLEFFFFCWTSGSEFYYRRLIIFLFVRVFCSLDYIRINIRVKAIYVHTNFIILKLKSRTLLRAGRTSEKWMKLKSCRSHIHESLRLSLCFTCDSPLKSLDFIVQWENGCHVNILWMFSLHSKIHLSVSRFSRQFSNENTSRDDSVLRFRYWAFN